MYLLHTYDKVCTLYIIHVCTVIIILIEKLHIVKIQKG